ncbi:MAG: alpha/beta hydrolase [Synechococcales bacterium]|nr:alpha/beta hydrolase [Synechococcales bacterium]
MVEKISVGLLAGSMAIALGSEAIAAERVVLTYGVLQRSVSVEDLTLLAETGETSSTLGTYLDKTGRDAEELRGWLTRDLEVSPTLLDRSLNNPLGDAALDRIGETIHTRSGGANRQALRAALILSASDDERISLIEVLQNYPTEAVYVNGERLQTAYRDISRVVEIQQDVSDWLDGIL